MVVFLMALGVVFMWMQGSQALANPWPLGMINTNSLTDSQVPSGYTSRGFTVRCPGVSNNISGFLAIRQRTGAPRGLLVMLTGGDGDKYWTSQHTGAYALAEELRTLGFTIVQVRWVSSWLESAPGEEAGPARLGCRPATVIKYIHDHYYLPLGVQSSRVGEAGFGVTGNSGGASQTCYALSYYGLDTIIDVAIPTGGPPHAALAKACMNTPGQEAYWYATNTLHDIDRCFGFFNNNGPAFRHDPAYIPRWIEQSHSTGGHDYYHPRTRVHFIQGETDWKMRVNAQDYMDRLKAAGTPFLVSEIAPNTAHAVYGTDAGRAAIKNALLGVWMEQAVVTNGQVRFNVTGITNFNYIVQRSGDLIEWVPVRTNRGPFTFSEPVAESAPRFYRVAWSP
jgi:hypothetical protein